MEEDNNPYRIFYENYTSTNAATECTGLIPAGPDSREIWENYQDIFNFQPLPYDDP